MHDALGLALKRIDRDDMGIPAKLYPITRSHTEDSPTIVVINPSISAGRPVLGGTGVATRMIFERCRAGEFRNPHHRLDRSLEHGIQAKIIA